MSQPRAFCSPHLGLRNAGKRSPSPPSATAIRTWGFFCYFFVAVCLVCVWFKNVWQSLRDCWGYFHLLRNFSLCHSSCPWLGILAQQKTAFLLSFFTLFLTLFIQEEWKAGQFKPIKNSITNHGKKTYLCLLKRLQTEKTPDFQPDTWR